MLPLRAGLTEAPYNDTSIVIISGGRQAGQQGTNHGREAYARYGAEVGKLIIALGGRIRYSGAVTGLMIGEVEELWDMVALAEYPSLAAFHKMATSPEMRAIEHHRHAGLAGQLNIRTKPRD